VPRRLLSVRRILDLEGQGTAEEQAAAVKRGTEVAAALGLEPPLSDSISPRIKANTNAGPPHQQFEDGPEEEEESFMTMTSIAGSAAASAAALCRLKQAVGPVPTKSGI
jgi:hypothetical protein